MLRRISLKIAQSFSSTNNITLSQPKNFIKLLPSLGTTALGNWVQITWSQKPFLDNHWYRSLHWDPLFKLKLSRDPSGNLSVMFIILGSTTLLTLSLELAGAALIISPLTILVECSEAGGWGDWLLAPADEGPGRTGEGDLLLITSSERELLGKALIEHPFIVDSVMSFSTPLREQRFSDTA
jgi:hypothetical protein